MMDEKRLVDVIADLSDAKLSNIAQRLSSLEKSSIFPISRDGCRDLIGELERIKSMNQADKKLLLPFVLMEFFDLMDGVQGEVMARNKVIASNKQEIGESWGHQGEKLVDSGKSLDDVVGLQYENVRLQEENDYLKEDLKEYNSILKDPDCFDLSSKLALKEARAGQGGIEKAMGRQGAVQEAMEKFSETREAGVERRSAKSSVHLANRVLCSDKFKAEFQEFNSLKKATAFFAADPTSERARYWKEFVADVLGAKNSDWYANFKRCFTALQGMHTKGIEFSKPLKEYARGTYGAIGAVVSNRHMDKEGLKLLDNLLFEIDGYQNAHSLSSDPIILEYASETQKDICRRSLPEKQFERDVGIWESYLFQDKGDPAHTALTDKRTDIVKRLFLTLEGSELKYKNHEDSSHKSLLQDNKSKLQSPMPLASVLSHGGRIMIEIPSLKPGEDPAAFYNWLIGGEDQRSRAIALGDAEQEGKPVYSRLASSHLVKIEEGVPPVEQKLNPINPIHSVKILKAATKLPHSCLNLGLKEPGHPAREDGGHGHLYFYWSPPQEGTPGVLLVGCEGSAPEHDVISYYGQTHGWLAVSNEFSPTGGLKFSAFPDGYPIKPDSTNGLKVEISAAQLKSLMTLKADAFTQDQLSQPAGTQTQYSNAPPPRPKKVAPALAASLQSSVLNPSSAPSGPSAPPPRPSSAAPDNQVSAQKETPSGPKKGP